MPRKQEEYIVILFQTSKKYFLITAFFSLWVIRCLDSHALTMLVKETCGCALETLQVETKAGNFPIEEDGTVRLKNVPKGTSVSLESDIKGFWCPTYACKHLSGEWVTAREGGTLDVTCLKKPLPKLPCFINIPKYFGWP